MNKDTSGMFKTPKELLDNNPSLPDYIITRRNAASCAEFISKNRPEKDVIEAIQAKLTQAGIESKIYRTDDSDNTLALANPQQIQHAMRAMGFPEEYISWITTQAEILNANLTTKEPRSNVVIDEESGSITLGNTPLLSKIEIIQKDGKLEYVLHVKISNDVDKANFNVLNAFIETSNPRISYVIDNEGETVTLNTLKDLVKTMLILGCSDEQISALPEASQLIPSSRSKFTIWQVRPLHPSGVSQISIDHQNSTVEFLCESSASSTQAQKCLNTAGIPNYRTLESPFKISLRYPEQIQHALKAMGFTGKIIQEIASKKAINSADKDGSNTNHNISNIAITEQGCTFYTVRPVGAGMDTTSSNLSKFLRENGIPNNENNITGTVTVQNLDAQKAMLILGYSDADVNAVKQAMVGIQKEYKEATQQAASEALEKTANPAPKRSAG